MTSPGAGRPNSQAGFHMFISIPCTTSSAVSWYRQSNRSFGTLANSWHLVFFNQSSLWSCSASFWWSQNDELKPIPKVQQSKDFLTWWLLGETVPKPKETSTMQLQKFPQKTVPRLWFWRDLPQRLQCFAEPTDDVSWIDINISSRLLFGPINHNYRRLLEHHWKIKHSVPKIQVRSIDNWLTHSQPGHLWRS